MTDPVESGAEASMRPLRDTLSQLRLRELLVEVQDRRDLTAQIEEGLDDLMLGGGRCRQLVCRR